MKFFKFVLLIALQSPLLVFYYLEPTNPIYLIILQVFMTLFVSMVDTAVSQNVFNIQSLNQNFENLLQLLMKQISKVKNEKWNDFEDEV
jgi:hypothetical protein